MASTNQESWTVLRLLEWTTEFFKKKDSPSPRLDAEILLAHARGCQRIELYTAFGEEPDDEQRVAFRELVRRRGEGAPVAQLVGYREFYSLKFRVDDNVLIPRPETEHLVVETLDVAKSFKLDGRPLRIVDIGTGSGAIVVSLAKNLPNAELFAVDQSESALEIAKWNANQQGIADRISFSSGDLLSNLDQPEVFDVICSNPPYVSESEYAELSSSVRDFEPREALVAGPKGTEIIERLLTETQRRLAQHGRMILELSPMIAQECKEMAKQAGYTDARLIRDLAGHHRILSIGKNTTTA